MPAILLAVFISTQIGLIGHLHADDSLVADCLQCQLDNGQAAISNSKLPSIFGPTGSSIQHSAFAAPTASIYVLKARGPPTLS